MGEAGAAAFVVTNDYNKTSLLLSSLGYATKYFDLSVHYEHYSDFAKVNNNGSCAKVGGLGKKIR